MRQVEIKWLEQKIQLNDLRVAATTSAVAFARNTDAVNSVKATATITAARPTTVADAIAAAAAAAVSAVNQTAPLRSIMKTRAMDRSGFQIYAYK